jgi:hypothetical protein
MLPAGEKFELMALLSRRALKNNMPSVFQIYSTVFVTKPINIFLLPFFKKGISKQRVCLFFHEIYWEINKRLEVDFICK